MDMEMVAPAADCEAGTLDTARGREKVATGAEMEWGVEELARAARVSVSMTRAVCARSRNKG